jgi:NADPH:quinone reductase-like Zn-dependent oxidoreductase
MSSNSNRGVVYLKPGSVEVQKIDFPTFRNPAGKTIDHGVILKVVTTNICGSDQHMVRGRTTAPAGMVLGHEITGEVIEKGATSSISMSATSYRSLSTSHAAAAGPVERATLASASTSTPTAPEAPMDMLIWADGSAARPTT